MGIRIVILACWLSVCLAHPVAGQKVDHAKADSVAAVYTGYPLSNLFELSEKLTSPFDSEEMKFRAIYSWVCNNVESDYKLFVKHRRKLERWKDQEEVLKTWNQTFAPRVFRQLIQEGTTLCSGYAYLLKQLAWHAGIECEVVNGYGRTLRSNIGGEGIVNHAWNVVKLEGKWYLCDPTWSSGYIDGKNKRFVADYNDNYFLADPAIFIRNHFPADERWILLDAPPSLNVFLNSPLVFSGIYESGIIPVQPARLEQEINRGDSITFRFNKLVDSDRDIQVVIVAGSQRTEINPFTEQSSGGYHFMIPFNHRGRKEVYFYSGDQRLWMYYVDVR